ncbi:MULTISPECIES: flagellar biosynthesis protein FlhA [unclassified Exiguobacterium]|uniref:flagellar biosynthesis protein FlhA n=1 Tax=unclassified Exiguobacterium TaxID=2644629 RepID=UPI001038729F|nr:MULTISPECIES: flagellar biosynthesis protein FlhA [unclassified Exiguobacterium]TCI73914.1 flagellar biosynthesis protein FlhA [Exiguobacterium sp. IPCI3]TCI83072.1 flagellar biosynthesis protein FlhA [Exiguobacterium sp. IPCH1]TCI84127.1 flagellar biosynthesis protein FlhA [Exiguobacterium sp. IPBC4]
MAVKAKDFAVLIGVLLIVVMLVIPLPGFMLDFLIIVNILVALLILLVAMNAREALDFSVFPSLLLIVTLFRLGLNVSTTRSILSTGYGGEVIATFGNFVVGGKVLVGFVVFLILVIIQFVVITKGAERVSEVSARFTLDAMPGKQMAIDADLNSGLIDDKDAQIRRKKIQSEADFYGSMDGASKFVKGDAIAGIIIVAINLIFGIIIGVVDMGLPVGEAFQKFSLMTIGDGLVGQIPALLISTATGIIVTRAVSDGNLGEDVVDQLSQNPTLLYIAGSVVIMLGIISPSLLPVTLIIAGATFYGAYTMRRNLKRVVDTPLPEEEPSAPTETVVSLLQIDAIEFEFGYGLIPLADESQGGDLLDRVVMIRRQLALELGFILPTVRIRDHLQLSPNAYRIKVKGNVVAEGELLLDHYLAMSPGIEDPEVYGIETTEPAFGLPALWIDEETRTRAEMSGYTVVDPPSVVATHLTETLKKHAADLLGREETKQLVEHLKETHPVLVEDVTPSVLSIGDIQKVLRHLLKEHVSIRNLPLLFETMADYGKVTKDADILGEYCRQGLSRQLTDQVSPPDGPLYVVTLGGQTEQLIQDAVQKTEFGNYLALDPEQAREIIERSGEQLSMFERYGASAVILCSPTIRLFVRQLLERYYPDVPVLAYNELLSSIEVKSIGVI